MAIRRISAARDKSAHECVRCGRRTLGELRNGRTIYCHACGCKNVIQYSDQGNLIVTDKEKLHLFTAKGKEKPPAVFKDSQEEEENSLKNEKTEETNG